MSQLPLSVAAAEELQADKAAVLFREGRALAREARWGEACERFERSLEIADGVGTAFNLADCWEHIGRFASAQALFAKVAHDAGEAGQSDREAVARERAAALEPNLSYLTIEVPSGQAGMRVLRDGEPVEPSSWGKPLVIDPGPHSISVTAPGEKGWSRFIDVPAKGSLLVSVPRLGAREAPLREASEPTKAAPNVKRLGREPLPPAPPKPSKPEAVTIGLLALGVGSAAAGTAFLLKHRSLDDDADALCQPRTAPCAGGAAERNQLDRLERDAKASRTGALLGFGLAGGAFAGAAFSYWVLGLRQKDSETGFQAAPAVGGDGSIGVVTRGRF